MGTIYRNGTQYGGGGSGAGGHEIVDTDGSSLPAEDKLQFIGLDVTDNSTDGETEVESFGLNTDSLDDVVSGNISVSIVQPFMNYSTNETVVGKWIDGKPIYQKTLHLTASELVDGTIIHTLTATGECVGSEINRAIRTDDGIVHPYSVVGGTNIWQSGVFITSSDTTRVIRIYNRGTVPAKEAWITIRYTK